MAKPKGSPKTGGRQKGTANKPNQEIKDMIREALDGAHEEGGVEYLKARARDNPTAFLTLIGKIIPADVNAKLSGNVTISWPLPRTKLDE